MGLGQEIRRRRKGRDWTLERLAEESGLSAHYLSNLENDGRDPSLSSIEAVSRALGAEPADLLGGVKDVHPEAADAARVYETLPKDAQALVLALMRMLSSSSATRTPRKVKKAAKRTRKR